MHVEIFSKQAASLLESGSLSSADQAALSATRELLAMPDDAATQTMLGVIAATWAVVGAALGVLCFQIVRVVVDRMRLKSDSSATETRRTLEDFGLLLRALRELWEGPRGWPWRGLGRSWEGIVRSKGRHWCRKIFRK